LFSSYDVIVCAPGPYLAAYDARAPSALSDISIASGLGLRVVLSSHSIGPLAPAGLGAVRRATCIAREPSTYAYLRRHGVACTKAADLAFLYPFERARAGSMSDVASPYLTPYRLAFLRSNNIRAATLRLGEDGALRSDGRTVVPAGSGPLILATSDDRRDRRFVNGAARRLGVASVVCRTVAELVQLVERASLVVSDRYHPAICAAVLGVPATVLPNREPHKMQGLGELLADRGLPELQALARNGLEAVRAALRQVA
jgi:polysaccharide pyruvyl transferase WcaK-like protein